LTSIAKKIVLKHPATFMEEFEDGKPIGNGSLGFERQLETRMNYLRRNKTGNLFPDMEIHSKKRASKKDTYSCASSLPTELPAGETLETQEEDHL
jgi:hypothetical protein